jgi:hypothetical protein
MASIRIILLMVISSIPVQVGSKKIPGGDAMIAFIFLKFS